MKPFNRLTLKQKDVVLHALKFDGVYPNSPVANHHAKPLSIRSRYSLNCGVTIASLEVVGWLKEDGHLKYELTNEARQELEAIVAR